MGKETGFFSPYISLNAPAKDMMFLHAIHSMFLPAVEKWDTRLNRYNDAGNWYRETFMHSFPVVVLQVAGVLFLLLLFAIYILRSVMQQAWFCKICTMMEFYAKPPHRNHGH